MRSPFFVLLATISTLSWIAADAQLALSQLAPPSPIAQATTQPAAIPAVEPFSVMGRLDANSQVLADNGTYYNEHSFEGVAGQSIVIEMSSDELDTYLILQAPDGRWIAQNDNSNGTNSRIAGTLQASGTYTISANASIKEEQSGSYTLSLREASANDLTLAAADRLDSQCRQQYRVSQFREALESCQQALDLYREAGVREAFPQESRVSEGTTLNNIGNIYNDLGQYLQALEQYQQALSIHREMGDRASESTTLNNIGTVYRKLGQYSQALELYQQALVIQREISDRAGEGITFHNIGGVYASLGQYSQALELYQQALDILREIDNRALESATLNNIGEVYRNLGQYPQALEHYQQALGIARETGNRAGAGTILNNIGSIYDSLGQCPQALEHYQQALDIARETGNRAGAGTILNNIGSIYDSLGQYPQALEHYQQALGNLREIGDPAGEGRSLNNIGSIYDNLGQYPQALEQYQQSLVIAREIRDRAGEGTTLNNIGGVYRSLGQYPQALEQFQQALSIAREIGDRAGEGSRLNNIGSIYDSLGQYPQALEQYQQALGIAREIGDRSLESSTLNNIGGIYDDLGRYPQALEQYQQSLVIRREIGDRAGEGAALNNTGGVYDSLGQYPQALEQYQQALGIVREVGDRTTEGTILNNIAGVYQSLGQYPQALEQYQQSLVIRREIGDRQGEGTTLHNIGYLLADRDQSELAIVFLKESVNVYESIRGELRTLSTEQQQSYTDTVADSYRKLADLLLQENRILEAQRVLDLLKVQELADYLEDVQRSPQTQSGVDYWQPEERILALYQQVIEGGEELARLDEQDRTVGLTASEVARYNELSDQQQEILSSFGAFIDYPEVQAAIAQLRQTTQGQNIEVAQLNALQTDLRNLQQDAVLLYPLILGDRLELVLVTPYAPPIRRPVDISSTELNRLIVEMGQALKNPGSDARGIAQQLYEVLIQPLEADLAAAQARTIICAPDGALRYIPLAALYDGEQWLAQRFAVTHITAASLTRFDDRPSGNLRVLAAACAECEFDFNVGTQSFQFADLPYTQSEVETLATIIPNTTTLINQAFSPTELQNLMRRYSVVHLATHAAFVQGRADESFIVFGNGEKVPLSQIRTDWNLPNTDLVVLSACETAVGEAELGSGVEILGFGYQMQQTGASSAIASLWQVSDGGTQVLMNAFYAGLENGLTKAEALRQAQIALITGDFRAAGGDRGSIAVVSARNGLPVEVSDRLDHPYYWAPFILIGNGL